MYYVYMLTNQIISKCYYGYADYDVSCISMELISEIAKADKTLRHLSNSFRMHGDKAFTCDIIETTEDLEEAKASFESLVNLNHTRESEYGYNYGNAQLFKLNEPLHEEIIKHENITVNSQTPLDATRINSEPLELTARQLVSEHDLSFLERVIHASKILFEMTCNYNDNNFMAFMGNYQEFDKAIGFGDSTMVDVPLDPQEMMDSLLRTCKKSLGDYINYYDFL